MARLGLTASKINGLKATGKAYRKADGDGLYLFVTSMGGKSWQYRYRHGGRQQTLTIGKYPAVTLADARTRAQDARKLAAKDEHLTRAKHTRRAQKTAATGNTFAKVAANWVDDEARRKQWTDDYRGEVKASLRNHLSKLDALPITEITAAICSPIFRASEKAAPDMAKKVRQRLRGILDYAVEHGALNVNPIPAPRGGASVSIRHLPAILTHDGVGEILRAADKAECCKGVRRAHLLCAFTAQRISEIVGAQWAEFDLILGTWAIPRQRMKRKDSERGVHLVPIPAGLLAKLVEWKRDDGEGAVHTCPAPRGKRFISREAVEKFYRRTLGLAGQHSPHGWRSVFSTWSYESAKAQDLIEAQLDHVVGNTVQQAYDRASRLELRRELIQWHEAGLVAARDGSEGIKIGKRRAS